MADPWAILAGINSGPSIADLYIGAKQRRINEMMMQRKMEHEDQDRALAAEERSAIAAATTPVAPSARPNIAVDPKYREASQFMRLSQLAGVGNGKTLADAAGLSQPAPRTIDAFGRKAMVESLGSDGYAAWKQRHGIVEADSAAPAPQAPPVASVPQAAPMTASPVMPSPHATGGPDEAENLIPADAGLDAAPVVASGGMSLNPEGLQRLKAINPKLAFDLMKMDAEQRVAAHKAITEQIALESRIIGAVRAAPEADQQQVYTNIRNYLGAKGITGLPEQWNPALAETHQRMGLTAMQAFQDDRAERRLAQDIADDEADNERADRNTASLIEDREGRRGLVARGQDLTDARGRRGQDITSADRKRGQDISSADRRYATDNAGRRKKPAGTENIPTPKSAAERDKLPKGTLYRAPDGSIQRRN